MQALPPPTGEQEKIIECVRGGSSAAIHAVAGSGKTTSVLHVAQSMPRSSILFLTYSASLKEDTRIKLKKTGICNLEAHSFHSFACTYYHRESFDNLRLALSVPSPLEEFFYDIIVVDEVQDMTPCIYQFLCKVIHDNGRFRQDAERFVRYLLLGDTAQCIYRYRDSDPRYLSLCERLLGTTIRKLALSMSFRLTKQMAGFVNHVLRGKEHWQEIRSERDVPESVVYLRIDSPFEISGVVDYVQGVVQSNKILPEDIYVIAPTVQGVPNNPCVLLQKLLKSKAPSIWPNDYCNVHVKTHGDENSTRSEILKSKMCFMNFHQSKGREAKVTVVFNIDRSYFTYYDDSGSNHLTEALLVSLTRAREKLIVVEAADFGPLEFLDQSRLEEFATVYDMRTKVPKKRKEAPPHTRLHKKKTVTELCRHVMEETVEACCRFFDTDLLDPPGKTVHVEGVLTVVPGKLYEPVQDLNGMVVTLHARAIYEGQEQSVPEVITEAIELWTEGNKYTHRKAQIPVKKRTWIQEEALKTLTGRLLGHLSGQNVLFEQDLPECHEIRKSIVDVMDRDRKVLWEVKNTDKLRPIHFVQAALYSFLAMENGMHDWECRILNVRTGEAHRVVSSRERLREMVRVLLSARPEVPRDDDGFVEINQAPKLQRL